MQNMKYMKYMLLVVFVIIGFGLARGQFAPPAGQTGSDAVHADSSSIIAWANSIELERGFIRIDQQELGKVDYGSPENGLGKADFLVVSLGDAGMATLQFEVPLRNGPGNDFVVFENSFSDDFLELAFVEVSSDGTYFVRFPSTSFTPFEKQIGTFGTIDATKIHQLAGKYRGLYGVPFDLDVLGFDNEIDLQRITHIRIKDVVGTVNEMFASFDSHGAIINDPFPTPFPSGGFDLDAVGVINNLSNLSINEQQGFVSHVYPNPFGESVFLHLMQSGIDWQLEIVDVKGKSWGYFSGNSENVTVSTATLPGGMYFFNLITSDKKEVIKMIKY